MRNAVGIWNDFMSPLLYISDPDMWTLQMFVRQVTVSTDMASTVGQLDPEYVPPEQGVKLATVVIATIPILLVYPGWPHETEQIDGTLNPTDWWPLLGTNDAAQWGLAAIQNLALIGDHVPDI